MQRRNRKPSFAEYARGSKEMKTTLNKIREYSPCASGWEKLLSYLGKTKADDEPLLITTILDSNGLDDAIWCLRTVEGYDREIRLFAVWCARQVQHLLKDQRSLDALDVAERYANGEATDAELTAAKDAAWSAEDVVRAAAWAAEDAAWAAWAAEAARDAAWTAVWAAEVEMRQRQESELRRICGEVVRDENNVEQNQRTQPMHRRLGEATKISRQNQS